jgi:UDP-N-acetylmuramyl pentapeptide phosphotransferase/UDP-N-acetylglucosamine-1-phosphate transferase
MILSLAIIVFVLSAVTVPLVAYVLNKKGILDQPDRVQISHNIPTPRGGGLAVMPIIFLAWIFLAANHAYAWPNTATFAAVITCGIILCGFTWFDDHKPGGLRVRTRLGVQLIAAAIPLIIWPGDVGDLLPGVPVVLERILMALAWVWFANLYNFMDGINGITGAETVSITGGLLIFCYFAPNHVPDGFKEMVVVPLAAAAGFLVWNGRKVAKIFLGDIGSIGFGYCLAWLLYVFAMNNYMVPAILVSLVYCLDATITLIKRAWQKKKIWEAHREHFYHRATVPEALNHLQCVGVILIVNAMLIGLGLAAMKGMFQPVVALALGMVLVFVLLTWFYFLGRRAGHVSSPRPKAFWIERLLRVFIKRQMIGRK